jgi:superfamily II DNA or RNA helicase
MFAVAKSKGELFLKSKKNLTAEDFFSSLDQLERWVLGTTILFGGIDSTAKIISALETPGLPSPPDKSRWTAEALDRILARLDVPGWQPDRGGWFDQTLTTLSLREIFSRPEGSLLARVARGVLAPGPQEKSYFANVSSGTFAHQLLLAFYSNNPEYFQKLLSQAEKAYESPVVMLPFKRHLLLAPFPVTWIASLDQSLQRYVLSLKIENLITKSIVSPGLDSAIGHARTIVGSMEGRSLRALLLRLGLVAGHLYWVPRFPEIETAPNFVVLGIRGWEAFFREEFESSALLFREMTAEYRKVIGRRKILPEDPYGLFYAISLFSLDVKNKLRQTELPRLFDLVKNENAWRNEGIMAIMALDLSLSGFDGEAQNLISEIWESPVFEDPLSRAILSLALLILLPDKARTHKNTFLSAFLKFREVMPLPAVIYAEILLRLGEFSPEIEEFRKEEKTSFLLRPFLHLFPKDNAWERSLAGIESLFSEDVEEQREKRVAWLLDIKKLQAFPVEQTFKKGEWKGVKPIALKRVQSQDPSLFLSAIDQAVAKTIRSTSYGYYGKIDYETDPYETILALVGHPALYLADSPSTRIDLVQSLPELVITEVKGGYRLDLSHRGETPSVSIERISATRYRAIDLSKAFISMGARIPKAGLFVPKEARSRVVSILQQQAPFLSVRAEITESDIPAVEGKTIPVLQIEPLDLGLAMTVGVRPFGSGGHFFPVGGGGRLVSGVMDGKTVHARRNLEEEMAAFSRLLDSLPVLSGRPPEGQTFLLDDPEEALQLLLELQETVHPREIEWPRGETMKVSPPVTTKKIRLDVREARDWFEIDGKVEVDHDLDIGMKDLLSAMKESRGRFVPLGEGRFLTLTERLRSQLERFREVSEEEKGGQKVSHLGTLAIEEMLSEAGSVTGDKKWKAFKDRIRKAADYTPSLPSTLQAELRDYQVEGFLWMSRLAKWGAGACLADDMGLGKTVQAIAVMLDRAPSGPIIVIAPTSVCSNWSSEMARFAPSLNVHVLREAVDRTSRVEGLGPLDVLITSYGLLTLEEELLSKTSWTMAVFDEAQAFKNAETRRAQAARKIQADFRLALSGTPIENDLDELWSLFSAINPLLLGSRERFQSRFSGPIERQKDVRVLASLRSLVRPFMLRRTKSMVLSELPPRTEVTIKVELPSDERAFYEALRQSAIETLSGLKDEKGSQRIHILAEITKLRRALCHPSLVDPGSLLPGAKLTAFLELSSELLKNRHKALVFSQFTGQLEQVKKALDARGVSYQYLDGSTTPKERDRRVNDFQSGKGDLFLISLRAGGTGLNLTAADYVIHLDPWWNPAVEDQASDRAHRIGQQRPVTIYRLIATQSIEEKILDLHKKKRDLASDLLEGSEISGRLTNEDLIALIGL